MIDRTHRTKPCCEVSKLGSNDTTGRGHHRDAVDDDVCTDLSFLFCEIENNYTSLTHTIRATRPVKRGVRLLLVLLSSLM